MRIRGAVINTPKKPNLLPAAQQAAKLIRLFLVNRVDFAAMPESYTALRVAMNKSRFARVILTKPNTVIRGNQIGTALFINDARWRVLDVQNLNIDFADRANGLNMPVVLVKRRARRERIVLVGTHLPTKRSSSEATQKRINKEILEFCEQYDAPVIIMGDFNDGYIADQYKGYRAAARSNVDHVITRGFEVLKQKLVTRGVRGKITDHHAMAIAVLRLRSKTVLRVTKLSQLAKNKLTRTK